MVYSFEIATNDNRLYYLEKESNLSENETLENFVKLVSMNRFVVIENTAISVGSINRIQCTDITEYWVG